MSAHPIRILVVDDEPPIRKLLRTGLGTQGYEVLEAANGKAALEHLREKPDLDHSRSRLAGHAGHELLRILRGRDAGVPIVVLSSRGDEAGKVQALDLGADDYVTKPFGMNELLARIRAALRHQLQSQGERPVFRVGDLSVDLVRRIVKVRGSEVQALAEGIRDAPRARSARRQGADASVPPAGSVGKRDRLRNIFGSTSASFDRSSRRILNGLSFIQTETGVGYRLRVPEETLAGEQE